MHPQGNADSSRPGGGVGINSELEEDRFLTGGQHIIGLMAGGIQMHSGRKKASVTGEQRARDTYKTSRSRRWG